MASFVWTERNTQHVARHGVRPEEAEQVVRAVRPPYPESHGDGKWMVRGQTTQGRLLQVIYVFAAEAIGLDPRDIDLVSVDLKDPDVFYVIHAMPLSPPQRRQYRRRLR